MGIYIYFDEGAMSLGIPGKRINAEETALSSWEHACSVFIMPGGRDKPYHAALKGEGCRKIRKFVEDGGLYLGICAGAYFAAKRVVFDLGCPLEIIEERELAFFDGHAIGPAYGNGTFEYHTQKGARAAKIKTEDTTLYSYYNGGCTFKGNFSNTRILARYLDLAGTPPAIIECKISKGKAILSGVHLETSAQSLDPSDPYLSSLIPNLLASDEQRKALWTQILSPNP